MAKNIIGHFYLGCLEIIINIFLIFELLLTFTLSVRHNLQDSGCLRIRFPCTVVCPGTALGFRNDVMSYGEYLINVSAAK